MSRLLTLIGPLALGAALAVLSGEHPSSPRSCPGASPAGVTLWPVNANVPYVIGNGFTANQARNIRLGVAEWGAVSALNLVESPFNTLPLLTNGITFGAVGGAALNPCGVGAGGCSAVGMQGGSQAISLLAAGNVNRFLVAHEVGHALGLMHEHQRSDRGAFVLPLPLNYTGSQWAVDFGIDTASQNWSVYDYDSVMHYATGAFAAAGTNTLAPLVAGGQACTVNASNGPAGQGYCPVTSQMGQRAHLSIGDALSLAAMYGPAPAPTLTSVQAATGVNTGAVGLVTPPDDLALAPFQDWTLTLNGTRFFAGSTDGQGLLGTQVFFDSTQVTGIVLVNNAASLTATIPGALVTPGEHEIFVRNLLPVGGGDSSKLVVTVPCVGANTPTSWAGNLQSERFGGAIARLPDLDGDSIPEVGIGAPGYWSNRGRLQIINGATGEVIFERIGEPGDELGASIAAGDVDGDGQQDLLYGIPGRNGTGRVVARELSSNGASWGTQVIASDDGGGQQGARFGRSIAVSAAGDVVVGAPGISEVRIFSLGLTLVATIPNPVSGSSRFGASVSFCGDLDQDEKEEFIVGAPTADNRGLASIYRWGASPTALFTFEGPAVGSHLGYSVAGVGDTDLDGFADAVVGVPFGAGGKGIARLVSGRTGQVLFDIDGESDLDWTGLCVGPAGDFDQDGHEDLIVGSPNAGGQGRVEVISGRDARSLWRRSGSSPGGFFGLSVCIPGDPGGDGLLDILVGSPFAPVPSCSTVLAGTVERFHGLGPMGQEKLMITEVAWGAAAGVEIVNFDAVPHDLDGWTLEWRFTDATGAQSFISDPIDQSLDVGQVMVVRASGGDVPGVPFGAQELVRFSSVLPGGAGALAVALCSPTGSVVDEVRVVPPLQAGSLPGLGGLFRGPVVRTGLSANAGGSIERIWGLDTNGPEDWTEQPYHSLGWESRSSGPRGVDAALPPRAVVRITEIDPRDPDYLELHNVGAVDVDLTNWYVRSSGGQGMAHTTVRPFPYGFVLPASARVVIGNGVAPAELPSGVSFLLAQPPLLWGPESFDCALYDQMGRVIDVVRTTGYGDKAVHNHPRAPSHWEDFVGAAGRSPYVRSVRGHVIGRTGMGDSNTGGDWAPLEHRTMGFANAVSDGPVGHGMPLDVRVHSIPNTGGLELVAIVPPAMAGAHFFTAISLSHSGGLGPFLGIGMDGLDWFSGPGMTLPWTGQFDDQGSFRVGFPGDALPLGLEADVLAIAWVPGTPALITRVLQYDVP